MPLMKIGDDSKVTLTKDLLGDDEIPLYAILSHTWQEGQEITHSDFVNGTSDEKIGYKKIQFCVERAQHDGLRYFWIDTCCIDKRDAVELQTAINSMFRCYRDAAKCYAFLTDVSACSCSAESPQSSWESAFRKSRWFTRGWTLQELLAPRSVTFYSQEGRLLGDRDRLRFLIMDITSIPTEALSGTPLTSFPVEERLSWIQGRKTMREEGKTYSLLGLFDIHLPMIYGEGQEKALGRLRKAIGKSVGNSMNDDPVREERRKECVRSLSFPEQNDRLNDVYTATDTCKWLSDDPRYVSWARSFCGLLWIKGDPGVGKSVLMKHAVEAARAQRELVVPYFIHGHGTPLQRSSLGVVRALLNALLDPFPDTLTEVTETYSEREERIGHLSAGKWAWSQEELQRILYKLLTKETLWQPVVIFIDALDECGHQFARQLLAYIRTLVSQAALEGARLKVCVSSRHYPIIGYDTIPSIMVEKENAQDIAHYISERTRDIQPETRRQRIREELLSKAQGGFQWVYLITETITGLDLTGANVEALLAELASCPQDLGMVYETLLAIGSDFERLQSTKLLQWVMFARDPLSLEELRDALAVDADSKSGSIKELRAHACWSDSTEDFVRHLRHISRGLVSFHGRSDSGHRRTAQLIHQYVADFLSSQHSDASSVYQAKASHSQIARSYLRYLTLEEVTKRHQGRLPDVPALVHLSSPPAYPLANYASSHILDHTMAAGGIHVLRIDLLGCFARSHDQLDGVPLIQAMKKGNTQMICTLFKSNSSAVEARNILGQTVSSVNINAWKHRSELLLFLLIRGDFLTPSPVLGEFFAKLSQHNLVQDLWATLHGRAAVRLLLSSEKTDIDFVDENRRSSFWYAVLLRQAKFAQLILATNPPKIDRLDIRCRSPLSTAAENGDLRMVNMLLGTQKVDVRLPFLHAAHANKIAVAKVLLATGKTDINVKDHRGYTPLYGALAHVEMVEFLLKQEAVDVNAKDQYGLSLLCSAVISSKDRVVELLLACGKAKLGVTDHAGNTLLWIAVYRRRTAIVEQMLAMDKFDVNMTNKLGQTTLSLAVARNDHEMCRLLLEKGNAHCDDKGDSAGRSQLWWAAKLGFTTIVKLLLDARKLNTDCTDTYGETPLSAAMRAGDSAMTKLLIDQAYKLPPTENEDGTSASEHPPQTDAIESGTGSPLLNTIQSHPKVGSTERKKLSDEVQISDLVSLMKRLQISD